MKFTKGKSGNPSGRPKGIRDRRLAFREHLERHTQDLIAKVIKSALAGDMAAMRLCLERIAPPLRAKDEAVILDRFEGSLTDQGQTVLKAVGNGTLTPAEGASLLQALASQARLVETDDLARRVETLEQNAAVGKT